MQNSTQESAWDFSPVYSLLNSLSNRDVAENTSTPASTRQSTTALSKSLDSNNVSHEDNSSLGNFDSLWDYLGVQRNVPAPSIPSFDATSFPSTHDKDAYASDGAINYLKSSTNYVHYETDAGALADDDNQADKSSRAGLTATQKRKARRQRAAEREKAATNGVEKIFESDDSIETARQSHRSFTQPEKVLDPSAKSFTVMQDSMKEARDSLAKAVSQKQANQSNPGPKAQGSVQPKSKSESPKKSHAIPSLRPPQVAPSNSTKNKFLHNSQTLDDFLKSKANVASPTPKGKSSTEIRPQEEWPTIADPVVGDGTVESEASNQLPTNGKAQKGSLAVSATQSKAPVTPKSQQKLSSVPVSQKQAPITPKAQQATLPNATIQTQPHPRKQHTIMPLQANAVDRHWSLLLKLLHNFEEERAALLKPLQLSINRTQPNGIHVFVDASNIIIGFNKQLRISRGYSEYAHIPQVDLSFHCLALLLERRRPIAKRVLAGSTPEIPAFEEARDVGYETCILDKVWKAKELTARQKHFAARANGGNDGNISSDNNASNVARLNAQQPKWVEQAVDEILHLKILESVIDTPSPNDASWEQGNEPPTMVLATGDAAEAEYSQGFKKMVERALQKGWKVELVCWAMSVSMEYRRMVKKSEWGDRFKIIELDGYSEELFGESV